MYVCLQGNSVIQLAAAVCLLPSVQSVACLGTTYLLPYCATFCCKFDVGIGEMKIKYYIIIMFHCGLLSLICIFTLFQVLYC